MRINQARQHDAASDIPLLLPMVRQTFADGYNDTLVQRNIHQWTIVVNPRLA